MSLGFFHHEFLSECPKKAWATLTEILLEAVRLQGTGQSYGLVSRNRLVSNGFYKGTLVSFLVLDAKRVLYLEV